MKFINKMIVCLGLVVFMTSCERDEIENIDIDVSTDKEMYAVNEPVIFNFSNNADVITFYSGEAGKVYRYKDRVELEGGKLEVRMETMELFAVQEQNLNFLVSTDFNGSYTKEGIESATWTNFSDSVRWSQVTGPGVAGTRTWSDYFDVSDALVSGKPIYFAYRYIGLAANAAHQGTWRIYNFHVQNRFSDTDFSTVATRTSAAWQAVTINNPGGLGVWFLTDASMIYYNPQSNREAVEKWVVSKRFEPNKVTPDVGESIKKYADNPMNSYSHSFNQPGEYEVTFVFSNVNYTGSSQNVKTIKVIVE